MSQKSKYVSLADLKNAHHAKPQPSTANSGAVYSTEHGRLCPVCGKVKAACRCQRKEHTPGDGKVRVSRETKGRKGKGVTIIAGLPLKADELKALAKRLKQFCGTGGTVREGVIEIQGDHRDKITEELLTLGFAAKKSGG